MNAPQFLRRQQAAAKREPLLHPVDLDQAANTVDLYAGRAKQQRTEAQVIGDTAEQAVIRATQLSKEVMQMVDRSKAIAAEIEREGLRLIAQVQAEQDAFNKRTEGFIASATTLHDGLLDVLAKVSKPQEPTAPAEISAETAETIQSGIAEILNGEQAKK